MRHCDRNVASVSGTSAEVFNPNRAHVRTTDVPDTDVPELEGV